MAGCLIKTKYNSYFYLMAKFSGVMKWLWVFNQRNTVNLVLEDNLSGFFVEVNWKVSTRREINLTKFKLIYIWALVKYLWSMFLSDHNFFQFIYFSDIWLMVFKDAVDNDYFCMHGFCLGSEETILNYQLWFSLDFLTKNNWNFWL